MAMTQYIIILRRTEEKKKKRNLHLKAAHVLLKIEVKTL